MRPTRDLVVSVREGCFLLIAFPLLGAPSPAQGENPSTKPAAGAHGDPDIKVGARVVLSDADVSLDDDGKAVPGRDLLALRIERIKGDRALVVSADKKARGWVRTAQVVPIDEAIDHFSEQIANNLQNAHAYWMRARLVLYKREDDRALADLDEAIRLDGGRAPYYTLRSGIHLKKGQFDKLVADAGKAIELDPNQDDAIADSSQAIKLGPQRAMSYVDRASLWTENAEYAKALADFDTAFRLDPDSAAAYAGRADFWAKRHEREKESADYTEAIRLDPNSAYYRVRRANSYSAQGLHARAIADYDEALWLEPNNAEIFVCRGIEWEKDADAALVEPDKAMADFERAIALDPKCASAYVARGRIWKQQRQFDQVVSNFAALVQNDPDGCDGHRYLARILATCDDAKIRDGKRAVAEATRACELTRWKDPNCLDTLAAACAESGDFETAIKWQTKAIECLPPWKRRSFDQDFEFRGRLALYRSKKTCRE